VRFTLNRASGLAVGLAALLATSAPVYAAQWVPGHYGPNGYWHPGHWVGAPDTWVAGHYGPNGYWHPGHWAGGYGPPPGPYEAAPGPPISGQHWVPGFYGPEGGWHQGYWAPN
jgi:hypothetical protein